MFDDEPDDEPDNTCTNCGSLLVRIQNGLLCINCGFRPELAPIVADKVCATDICPNCGIALQPEHAHDVCPRCRWRTSCCF